MTSKPYVDPKEDYKHKYFSNVSDSYAAGIVGVENEQVSIEPFVDYNKAAPKFDDISDDNEMLAVEGSAEKFMADLNNNAERDLRHSYNNDSTSHSDNYVHAYDSESVVFEDKDNVIPGVYQSGSHTINRIGSQSMSYSENHESQTTQGNTYDLNVQESASSILTTGDQIPLQSDNTSSAPSTTSQTSSTSKIETKVESLSDVMWTKSTDVCRAVRDTGTFISRKSIDNVLVDSLRDFVNSTEKEFNSFNQRVSKIFSKR